MKYEKVNRITEYDKYKSYPQGDEYFWAWYEDKQKEKKQKSSLFKLQYKNKSFKSILKEAIERMKTLKKVKCEEAHPLLHYEVKKCKQTKCLHYKFHIKNKGCEKDEECLQWNQKPCCFERNNKKD